MSMLDRLGKLKGWGHVVLVLVAVLILVATIGGLAVRPIARTLADMDARIAEAEDALARNEDVLRWRDDIAAEYAAIETYLVASGSPAEEADNMAAEIDRLLRAHDIDAPQMGGLRPREDDAYNEFSVEIKSFESDLPNLLQFLYQCHESPGLLRLSKMTLSPSRIEDGRVQGAMLITKVMTRE